MAKLPNSPLCYGIYLKIYKVRLLFSYFFLILYMFLVILLQIHLPVFLLFLSRMSCQCRKQLLGLCAFICATIANKSRDTRLFRNWSNVRDDLSSITEKWKLVLAEDLFTVTFIQCNFLPSLEGLLFEDIQWLILSPAKCTVRVWGIELELNKFI